MTDASWMLTLLGDETRPYHSMADGDRLGLMERSSAQKYRRSLEQIYRFEQPIEASLALTPGFAPSLLHTHLKTTQLANDLRELGVPIGASAQPAVAFDDVAQALGWLYVLHRNTRYHGLLRGQLNMLIPGEIRTAGSYLSVFDGVAEVRTHELGVVIDRAARQRRVAGDVVTAANDALRCQRQWYAKPAPLTQMLAC